MMSITRALPMLAAMVFATHAQAARITFVVEVPVATPAAADLWISGNVAELGSWNGAGVRLEPAGDRRYEVVVDLAEGTAVEFKVTRGGWETVEKGQHGEEISNRAFHVRGDETIAIAVATWRDQIENAPPRRSTLTGTIRFHRGFESKHVRARDLLVYLPPHYQADSTRRYPVLYFHDGRNVFDEATSFLGAEWGVDETAERLIRNSRLRPFIAVAIDNTPARVDEYTPAVDRRDGGGRAHHYAQFMFEELMPFIDGRYRTEHDAANTGVVGSSLGGILSIYLGFEHPDRFGLIGCVSPAVWWADRDIVRRARRAPSGLRLWVDVGTDEGTGSAGVANWLAGGRALRAALTGAGYELGAEFHYEEVEGAKHNERAWAARIDRILLFLLGAPVRDSGAAGAGRVR